VRVWMVERQRELGRGGGVIMEGRDIGTKVFPHAEVKIFLDANAEVRAERRQQQDPLGPAARKGVQAVAEQLRQRDQRDRTRAASPLEPAPDAIIIDSSHMGIDQVVACAEELVKARLRDRDAGGLIE
jgi:cytidylate kinase